MPSILTSSMFCGSCNVHVNDHTSLTVLDPSLGTAYTPKRHDLEVSLLTLWLGY